MEAHIPTLNADVRERPGSKYAQRLRQNGKLPAVMYGHGQDPVSITMDAAETLSHISKGEKLFTLKMTGGDQTVLLRDLQFDYLGNNIIHADFSRVDLEERIHTRVHVRLKGDAIGLKSAGAILIHPVTELDIECKVANLPDEVIVDISSLEVGASIHVRDITLPLPTMKMLSDGDGVVAHIVVQGEEKTGEATEATGEAAADAAKPEAKS
ncbi:MAG: 50S ribosomal protein L25 [Phycisphaeraceae bacterium]|nr:50S ribosomal protein L25 [Phycisphaerales bacterium]MCB9861380.1 50S ribosomal protein L25 [Phycisphaeraceae bacterium]